MTYLQVDKDGTETISNFKPIRVVKNGCWGIDDASRQKDCQIVEVPENTIYRLIGEKRVWGDEPFLFEGYR